MVDINFHHADGRTQRVRVVSPVQTRRGALAHERELTRALADGTYGKGGRKQPPPKRRAQTTRKKASTQRSVTPQTKVTKVTKAPTVAAFADDFITGHSMVEQLRRSTIDSQRGRLRNHILPVVGEVPVDAIRTHHFGELKRAMAQKGLSGKTINCSLTVLSRLTRYWYERQGLTPPRFKAGLIKLDEREAEFYEPQEYEALVTAARGLGPELLVLVLLMGDAGLRQGEVCALRWEDVRRFPEPVLRLKRTRYKDQDEPGTKGRKPRTVPMTARLVEALEALPRARRQVHVLVRREGQALTPRAVQRRLLKVERGAGIEDRGLSHKLRHTFATRLVANGVSLWVIKELLGHKDLRTTQRYLHMLTGAASEAIASLDGPKPPGGSSHVLNHGTGHGTMMAPLQP